MKDTGFSLRQELKKKTTVNISAFAEMLTSLHVLYRPDHHPYRVKWGQEIRNKLTNEFLNQLDECASLSDQWLGILDILEYNTTGLSVEQGLQKLNQLPNAEFLVLLYNQRFSLEQVLRWMNGLDEGSYMKLLDEKQRKALHRPGWTKRQMLEVLTKYDELIFQDEWKKIEPWLVRAERIFLEELEQNPIDALGRLHPRLFVKDDGLYAQKVTLYRMPYEEIKSIKVRPSTFVYPHLLLGWSGGYAEFPLAVNIPDTPKVEEVPEDLTRMFKALSDPTRLKIIRSLFLQPHCTQQLAHVHHITEAAVSKHLKILIEANYVTTERRGNYVFYSLKSEEMEMILVYLRQFLEQ